MLPHYTLWNMNDRKTNEIHRVPKNQADAFLPRDAMHNAVLVIVNLICLSVFPSVRRTRSTYDYDFFTGVYSYQFCLYALLLLINIAL